MKSINPSVKKRFFIIQLIIVAAVVFFPIYYYIATKSSTFLSNCLFHDWFWIYCPLCGGSRAVLSLLQFDFLMAVQQNALVVLFGLLALVWEIRAWIRFLKGDSLPYSLPKWIFVVLIILMIAFAVFRNVLMIGFRIDPLGDLLPLWNLIR